MTESQHGEAAASKSDAKDCDVPSDNSAEDVLPQINATILISRSKYRDSFITKALICFKGTASPCSSFFFRFCFLY